MRISRPATTTGPVSWEYEGLRDGIASGLQVVKIERIAKLHAWLRLYVERVVWSIDWRNQRLEKTMFTAFLCGNDSSNIAIALYCDDCPEALRMVWRAMIHSAEYVRPIMNHPLAFTNIAPPEFKAYGILCDAAAKIAREYWANVKAVGHRADCPCTWCKRTRSK